MKEQNLDMKSKGGEEKEEGTVEDIVKDENYNMFGVIAIVVEGITGILLPVMIGLVTGKELINIHICIILSAVTIIAYTIALLVLEKSELKNDWKLE